MYCAIVALQPGPLFQTIFPVAMGRAVFPSLHYAPSRSARFCFRAYIVCLSSTIYNVLPSQCPVTGPISPPGSHEATMNEVENIEGWGTGSRDYRLSTGNHYQPAQPAPPPPKDETYSISQSTVKIKDKWHVEAGTGASRAKISNAMHAGWLVPVPVLSLLFLMVLLLFCTPGSNKRTSKDISTLYKDLCFFCLFPWLAAVLFPRLRVHNVSASRNIYFYFHCPRISFPTYMMAYSPLGI